MHPTRSYSGHRPQQQTYYSGNRQQSNNRNNNLVAFNIHPNRPARYLHNREYNNQGYSRIDSALILNVYDEHQDATLFTQPIIIIDTGALKNVCSSLWLQSQDPAVVRHSLQRATHLHTISTTGKGSREIEYKSRVTCSNRYYSAYLKPFLQLTWKEVRLCISTDSQDFLDLLAIDNLKPAEKAMLSIIYQLKDKTMVVAFFRVNTTDGVF